MAATNPEVTTPVLLGGHKADVYFDKANSGPEEVLPSDYKPSSAPYTATRTIAFTPERAQEMVQWATPHNEGALLKKQQVIKQSVIAALSERCPFPIGDVIQTGSGVCGTLVRKYEEQIELIAFVTGLRIEGVEDYRGPFIDFMLEYLKHNLDRAPREGGQTQVPQVRPSYPIPIRTVAHCCLVEAHCLCIISINNQGEESSVGDNGDAAEVNFTLISLAPSTGH